MQTLKAGVATSKNMHLLKACESGDLAKVKALLAAGGVNVNAANKAGETALMFAATHQEELGKNLCQLLLDNGSDVNATDALGETALHKAHLANAPLVIRLLEGVKGVKVNVKNKEGHTPADKAELRKQFIVALLKQGKEDKQRGKSDEQKAQEKQLAELQLKLEACIKDKKCTIEASGRSFMEQRYRICLTCDPKAGTGVCVTCAETCHKGHDLLDPELGNFFCDCSDISKCAVFSGTLPEAKAVSTPGKAAAGASASAGAGAGARGAAGTAPAKRARETKVESKSGLEESLAETLAALARTKLDDDAAIDSSAVATKEAAGAALLASMSSGAGGAGAGSASGSASKSKKKRDKQKAKKAKAKQDAGGTGAGAQEEDDVASA